MKLDVKIEAKDRVVNILDIEVPMRLRRKISTGRDYFDAVLGGKGLTPSMVALFAGTPGAGKTTMLLELADGMTGGNTEVLFNTAEESLFQLKMTVDRLRLVNGFNVGQETNVNKLLKNCEILMNKNPKKDFVFIVDSLQCLTNSDKNGNITSTSTQKCLQKITDFCKKHYCNAIVISQVTKSGTMAGRNTLKHMVDTMITLSVEEKDEDLLGTRILRVTKNRFGGSGYITFLSLDMKGFTELKRMSF